MKTNILIVLLVLTVSIGSALAEDSPAMYFEPSNGSCNCGDSGTVDLMINTSVNEIAMQADILFDPACVNITDVDYTGTSWDFIPAGGWTHQVNFVRLGTGITDPSGIPPGEYKAATLTVECLCTAGPCTSPLDIVDGMPGLVAYNGTWTCIEEPVEPEDAVVSIGDGEGDVTIPIMINSSIPVGAADVVLAYNASLVMITDVANGSMDITVYNNENLTDGWLRTATIQAASGGNTGLFPMVYITFAPVGPIGLCPLELTVIDLYDDDPDDGPSPIPYTVMDGTYTYDPILCGDVNSDGLVDISDVMFLMKHLVGITGFETINTAASDCDGSGEIDIADAMFLMKYIVNIEGFETLRC